MQLELVLWNPTEIDTVEYKEYKMWKFKIF